MFVPSVLPFSAHCSSAAASSDFANMIIFFQPGVTLVMSVARVLVGAAMCEIVDLVSMIFSFRLN